MKISNPIELSVFNNLLSAIAEEMSAVIERTAYTTFVKEAHDFGAALMTVDGIFFAFPRKSGATSVLGMDASEVISRISDWQPGDVVLTNDPYATGGAVTHLPDLTLLSPIFVGGELVAFCWGFIHSSDIGGNVPGSIAPSNKEIYQEGLRIPPTKLYRAGVLNADLLELLRANVRIPHLMWGDLKALLSAFHVGSGRFVALFEKRGPDRSKQLVAESLAYAEAKARAVYAAIPDGTYRFTDYIEDDLTSGFPIRIELAITVRGSDVHLDYSGTDPQVLASYNVASAGKAHFWLTMGMMHHCLSVDPTIPTNGGIFRPITVTAPLGSLVNPVLPAAVGSRVTSVTKLLDMTSGALGQALPDEVPAASSGNGMIGVMSIPDLAKGGRKVSVFQVLAGGTGGRPASDGYDGTNNIAGFLRNTPVEVLEAEMDVLVHEYRYVPDSGGPGRFRGGLGVGMTIEALVPDTIIAMRGMERTRFAPWGVHGGLCGGRTAPALLNPGAANEENKGALNVLTMQRGDVLKLASAGGGGYGDPRERDPNRVSEDVIYGFVTRAQAEHDYGVVFKGSSLEPDMEATSARREELLASRPNRTSIFDYGIERERHDEVWSADSRKALLAILDELSIPARIYAKALIMAKAQGIFRQRSLKTIGREEILEGWEGVRAELGMLPVR